MIDHPVTTQISAPQINPITITGKQRLATTARTETVLSIHPIHEQEDLFLMANLFQDDTGLPMIIWVSEKGHAQHGPRIKVSKSHSTHVDYYNTVSVSISDHPQIVAGEGLSNKDLKLIIDYILLNKNTLLAYWNCEISTLTLSKRLNKVSFQN